MSETNESAIETESESAVETNAAAPVVEVESVTDPIDDLHHGECPSISGRSSLTYAIGRHN